MSCSACRHLSSPSGQPQRAKTRSQALDVATPRASSQLRHLLTPRGPLRGRVRLHVERVDLRELVLRDRVHEAVLLDHGQALEVLGHDQNLELLAAARALGRDLDARRVQAGFESCRDGVLVMRMGVLVAVVGVGALVVVVVLVLLL